MAYRHIGKDFVPPDVLGKVTGQARYAEDFRADGMAFARLYTSPMPHGRVRSVDASAALEMDGVLAILRAEDVPEVPVPQAPILTNHPVYVGEPILALAAVDEKTAEDALALVRVDMEPLPFVVDPLESLVEGGPNARGEGNVYKDSWYEPGTFSTVKWTRQQIEDLRAGRGAPDEAINKWAYGDLEVGFANAEVIIQESFVTTGNAHMSMEPRTSMALWQNGTCYLYGSVQSQSYVIPDLAEMLGVEQEKVVLISEHTGGGFGSKVSAYGSMVVPAYLSKKLGRPVQLRISGEEEYYIGSARIGFQGWIKVGVANDGRVTAVDLFIVEDIGPNATGGNASAAGGAVSIVFDPDAMRMRGVPVLTNTTPRGAQRGPGQNQIAAIMAPIIDKAARSLKLDRLAIRKKNAAHSGTTIYADQHPVTSAYMAEALDKGATLFDWVGRRDRKRRNGSKVTGIGIGQAYHSAGTSEFDGLVRITPDGKIHLHSGVGNLGTYSYASTTRAAAEVLKCSWENCVIEHGTTAAHLPWSSYQAGSNTSFTHSRANYVAALDAVAKIKQVAAETLGGSPEDFDIEDERVFKIGKPTRGMSYAEVAARAVELGGAVSGESYPDDIHQVTQRAVKALAGSGLIGVAKDNLEMTGTAPGLAAAFVEIELDLETGRYQVLDYVAIADCGTVVHPQGLDAQIRGGAVWGMSNVALERHVYDRHNGLPANVGYYQCRPATYLDVPGEMRTAAVDLPDPQSPFGARGIGEPVMGCAAAAMMSAISDALDGHLFNCTPVTADMIIEHLVGAPRRREALRTNSF
jgi:xanthine dehydrogenase molybdenum-binding subunit